MVEPVRRIITGHDAEGRSIFLEDGPEAERSSAFLAAGHCVAMSGSVDRSLNRPRTPTDPTSHRSPSGWSRRPTATSCASSSFRPTRSATTATRPRSSASMARRPSEARPMSGRTLRSNVRERRKISRPFSTSRSFSRLRHRRRGRDLGADGRRRDPDEGGRRADPARHQPCVEQPVGQAGAGVFCVEWGAG